ncbi:Hint domain-containing protein [Luteimicrobium subarcticum]|uniref:Hint domain-containing protein n=1 Tax=Luteimicrobium subarcticum TaxID=620910 RepID=UPI002481C68C|nr:Hint domain-containing protein [Luteimicrobium subarcticum]
MNGQRVTTTDEHPFMVAGLGWIAARDLRAGDLLVTAADPTTPTATVRLDAIDIERADRASAGETDPDGGVPVYNIHVHTHHTYYVLAGTTAVLVHNMGTHVGRLSDDLPRGMSHKIASAYDDIRAGNGVPRIDPATGKPKVFQGRRPHERFWAGAVEYDVAGAKGTTTRILAKDLGGGRTVTGWTIDHYDTIRKFSAPHFPDSGWATA